MSLESFPRGENKSEIKRPADGSFEENHEPEKYMTEEEKYVTEELLDITMPIDVMKNKNIQLRKVLVEGSIFLGRVSRIRFYKWNYGTLEVVLPSGLIGFVDNVDIGKSYKKRSYKRIIENECYPLSDLFKPGDYVVCCAKDIDRICSARTPDLSMEPQLINLKVRRNDLVKGFKIIGSVERKEDHGYVVDTGILNVTAFLATENIEEGKQYLPNTQLLCTVKEVETVGHTTVVELCTKEEKLVNVDDDDVVSLDVLMPGTKFSLRVKTVLSNCVQLYFGKDIFAYIHQIYLKHPLSTYKPDTNVTGTLLYTRTEPKAVACFSELDYTFSEEKETLRIGHTMEKAEVLDRDTKGIFFKLSESGIRGYVHFENASVPVENIETVFKKGSIHKCKILWYNWMECVYICYICSVVEGAITWSNIRNPIRKRDECNIVPKSASENFVTEPLTENKQELKRKRVSESHVDLANPSKKALKEVPDKANDTYEMYTHTLTVHAEAWKTEFEKFLDKVSDKFTKDYLTWLYIERSHAIHGDHIDKKLLEAVERANKSLAESRRLAESCYDHCALFCKMQGYRFNQGNEETKRKAETFFKEIFKF